MKLDEESLALHKENKGKIEIGSKVAINNRHDLSVAYSPGVAAPCLAIANDPEHAYTYTAKQNMVAVVSDGSAVLGLGNIGGLAGIPVMEGKAVLFKEFAGVDAVPLCLSSQDPHDIIKTVKMIAPSFGGINLEDIKAPECFHILDELQDIGIPVFHDDQDGTAIVTLAALKNALRVVKKDLSASIVILGAGAAGIAIVRLLLSAGAKDIVLVDSRGIVPRDFEGSNTYKENIARQINHENSTGSLADALKSADVLIGVSRGGLVTKEMVQSMAHDPIILAMANPNPEIDPVLAKEAGARVIGTGRSDYPNQINNVLVFPGLFRGLLDARLERVTDEMKLAVVDALAVENPSPENIIPPISKEISEKVAQAVRNQKE